MSPVGRTPRSAADALVGLVGISIQFDQRDQGVPRGPGRAPGRPPHNSNPKSFWSWWRAAAARSCWSLPYHSELLLRNVLLCKVIHNKNS